MGRLTREHQSCGGLGADREDDPAPAYVLWHVSTDKCVIVNCVLRTGTKKDLQNVLRLDDPPAPV